ncbi:MAG: hypothetical protein J5I59_06530 [Saprospiraceae bacterium]|nr:hypothetical protein [Saprospiraceae bacterium]
MVSLLLATVILSFIHALIPNHWLPLVAVSRAEKWSGRDVLIVGFASAFAHVLGTIILGILLGLVGVKLSNTFELYAHIIAPVILIVLGLIYFSLNSPHQHASAESGVNLYKRNKKRWILVFVGLMFLSPCLEVESIFLTAGGYGLNSVLLLSLVYGICSIFSIVVMIYLVHKGSHLVRSNEFIEHNEKKITGMVLIVIGLISFFLH